MIRLKRGRSEVYNGPSVAVPNILVTEHMQRLVAAVYCLAGKRV